MPESVIANTSPLFYLHRLGLIEILSDLYGSIMIPEAVAKELEEGASQGEDTFGAASEVANREDVLPCPL